MELDPVFVKALRLLHSRSKDSILQLRSLYEDALRARRSGVKISLPSSPVGGGSSRREGVEKRNFDKLKRDLSEFVPCTKRPRLSSPGWSSSKSHTPSPTPPGSRGDPSGGNSSCGEDPGIGELEMNLDNLTCIICKSLNQENGNILMECHTCQNLYHQECHSPAVSNEDADDPRLIWHCSQCAKTIKRVSPGLKGGSSSSLKGTSAGGRPSPSKGDVSIFKRVHDSSKMGSSSGSNGKSSSSGSVVGSSSASSSLSNVTSYKASSSLKSSSSSNRLNSKALPSGSSSSHSMSGSSSTSNIISADKRLQMMKKKAASRKK